jgi:hypothetical protein
MEHENWKPLPGFEDYEVSDLGGVRRVTAGKGTRPMRKINPTVDRGGRLVFNARSKNQTRQFKVHKAVMLAFVGECPIGLEVAHLDDNQENNKLLNLKYATPKENNGHKVVHGTQKRGEEIYSAKLTEKQVLEIRSKYPGTSYAKLGKEYGVFFTTISAIIKRRIWKHI